MLVVVANWGIADGTLVAASRHDQVAWLRAVQRAAIRAGFRRDGRYRPPERVDVVLAGDTFDLLTSLVWTTHARPWQRGPRAGAARSRVALAAAARGGRLLAGLRRWARQGIAVPAIGRHGRPATGTETRVPVGVAILAGDRDAWLEDLHAAAAGHGIGLGAVWAGSSCAAQVRHGHEFDPFTCGDGEGTPPADRGPTLGESLAVELVARFGGLLAADPRTWPVTRPLLGGLAGARPAQMAAAFRRWHQRSEAAPAAVGDLWKRAVDAWWRAARRTRPTCGVEFDPVDAIATTLAAAGDAAAAAAAAPFDLPVAPPGTGPLSIDAAADDAAAGRSTVLVLGHPRDTSPHSESASAVVCLGRAAAVRGGPPTVILTRHGDRVRRDWLHEESDATIVTSRAQSPDHVVEAA
jgi:hypothetical protein